MNALIIWSITFEFFGNFVKMSVFKEVKMLSFKDPPPEGETLEPPVGFPWTDDECEEMLGGGGLK